MRNSPAQLLNDSIEPLEPDARTCHGRDEKMIRPAHPQQAVLFNGGFYVQIKCLHSPVSHQNEKRLGAHTHTGTHRWLIGCNAFDTKSTGRRWKANTEKLQMFRIHGVSALDTWTYADCRMWIGIDATVLQSRTERQGQRGEVSDAESGICGLTGGCSVRWGRVVIADKRANRMKKCLHKQNFHLE